MITKSDKPTNIVMITQLQSPDQGAHLAQPPNNSLMTEIITTPRLTHPTDTVGVTPSRMSQLITTISTMTITHQVGCQTGMISMKTRTIYHIEVAMPTTLIT